MWMVNNITEHIYTFRKLLDVACHSWSSDAGIMEQSLGPPLGQSRTSSWKGKQQKATGHWPTSRTVLPAPSTLILSHPYFNPPNPSLNPTPQPQTPPDPGHRLQPGLRQPIIIISPRRSPGGCQTTTTGPDWPRELLHPTNIYC